MKISSVNCSMPAMGLGVSYLNKNKNASAEIQTAKNSNNLSFKGSTNQNDDRLWLAIMALSGIEPKKASLNENEKNDVVQTLLSGNSTLQRTSYNTARDFRYSQATQLNPSISKYSDYYYGVSLLKQDNVLNRDNEKYKNAIQTVQNIGIEKLTSDKKLPEIKKEHPVVWSVTSEFAPVKEGGLGVVPPELRNNAAKLGVDVPTFIPMYLSEKQATLSEKDGKYNYNYKGKNFELEKVVSFKSDSYKNSNSKTNDIEIFLHRDKDENGNEKKLVFIKCDRYFDGTIYESNSKTEEPEKFAIMSKAVYEFAKMKMDGANALKDTVIHSQSALDSIKAPDAMLLNDWQASPVAALMRYKSGMENAHGAMSDETASKLRDMPIVTIGHNVTYQGSTQNNNDVMQRKQANSNILNTLFDKYAYDIVSNAVLHTEKFDDTNLAPLNNVLLMNKENENGSFVNFLNMGVVLSDYFCPVSENYANELIDPNRPELSNYLQWGLTQKSKAGKLKGVINGNDYSNLNINAKSKSIKTLTGLDFKTYDKTTPEDELMQSRSENKINFYNNYILPFTESSSVTEKQIEDVKKLSSRLEFYKGDKKMEMPVLTDDEIIETPILTSGGRLVSQKGMDVLTGALELLYANWEDDFPNKPKPIFYIAGQDGEGGRIRKRIEDMKNNLKNEDNNRVLFAHGFVPMPAMMAASDYFLMPSIFEPCGLTQGESFAVATPVIASATGGITDTVNRNGKHNGILTDKNKKLTSYEFYEAMKQGMKTYFDEKNEYKNMVKNSIGEDFSWIQKGKTGPVYDYLEILGIKKENLPDAG